MIRLLECNCLRLPVLDGLIDGGGDQRDGDGNDRTSDDALGDDSGHFLAEERHLVDGGLVDNNGGLGHDGFLSMDGYSL